MVQYHDIKTSYATNSVSWRPERDNTTLSLILNPHEATRIVKKNIISIVKIYSSSDYNLKYTDGSIEMIRNCDNFIIVTDNSSNN